MFTKFLTVFFVSMLPLAELRVAVPLAVGMKLPLVASYIICIIGNMIPVPFIWSMLQQTTMDMLKTSR